MAKWQSMKAKWRNEAAEICENIMAKAKRGRAKASSGFGWRKQLRLNIIIIENEMRQPSRRASGGVARLKRRDNNENGARQHLGERQAGSEKLKMAKSGGRI
jgi:hypothetical protein